MLVGNRMNILWGAWVLKVCISYASTLVLAYGSPYNDFEVNRGLHEGDWVALFIFILATKCLYSILVNKNVNIESMQN